MSKAKWIWYLGDFELYHHMKLSLSRRERGSIVPTFWKVFDCNRLVRFEKKVTLERGEYIEIVMDGVGYLQLGSERYSTGKPIYLEKGTHRLSVVVGNTHGIPALLVTGETVFSDESWSADALDGRPSPVGSMDMPENVKPSDFSLPTERIEYRSINQTDKGIVYDFGRETYIKPVFNIPEPGCPLRVVFGESMEEVMSDTDAVIFEELPHASGRIEMTATACRYFRVVSEVAPEDVHGLYEYLPLETRGSFACSDEIINKIYEVSDYTLRLNSRLFYLDGIKRDGWVWGGDAYQSFFFNYYCHYDKPIIQRTLLALRGGDPIMSHVNTIIDYSLYWLISLGDYCLYTGDHDFIRKIYDKAVSLMEYCRTRENEQGLLQGYETDWTFVDWADMEKHGALCVIQILYCKALDSVAKCAKIRGDNERAESYIAKANDLRRKIVDLYWNEELGAFVTTFSDGTASKQVRRHANLLAIVFGIAGPKMTDKIVRHVIKNDEVPAITTPYFKFYELEALCKVGEIESVTGIIRTYWGGMLAEGATTFWEEYNPNLKGAEHYAMYGKPFDKSLCHAWGASPLYLLGRYYLGVRPLEDGYASFEVSPNNGGLAFIKGTVPVNNGSVSVESDGKTVKIRTDVPGGVFVKNGRREQIIPCRENTFTI